MKTTLIVTPVSLVGQWFSEITTRSTRPLTVLCWHGGSRTRDIAKIGSYDVVLTTYGVLASEMKSPTTMLASIDWHRIILDESHTIKDKNTSVTKNIRLLQSDRRWMLTGTPIVSQIDDIFSQFSFFDMPLITAPYVIAGVRSHCFGKGSADDSSLSSESSYALLIQMFTQTISRHKKSQRFNDRDALVELPPRTLYTIPIPFSPSERTSYDRILAIARTRFNEFAARGEVNAKYIQVLALLLPLRQASSAGTVNMAEALARLSEIQAIAEQKLQSATAQQSLADEAALKNQPFNLEPECLICFEIIEDGLMTKCRHVFCGEWNKNIINHGCDENEYVQ